MTQSSASGISLLKRILARIDGGLLMTWALCAFTLLPLLLNEGLPNGADVLYHTYRTGEMSRAWSQGLLFPRWADGLYYGYGSPLWHYYAGMTYYLGSLAMRLFSVDALNALRLLIVFSFMLGSGGMYLFMREHVGKLGGIIAGVVYIYSPYLLYTEPYARGTYPELLALAWSPVILWRYGRLLKTGHWRDWALAALAHAAIILTHNLMALVVTGFIAFWLFWEGLYVLRRGCEHTWQYGLAFGALVMGVALTAFFWLPVVLESDAVSLPNLTAVALLDYRNFFVSLNKLLGMPPLHDGGAINGLYNELEIGVGQWALALLGFIGTAGLWFKIRTAEYARLLWQGLGMALLAGLLIYMMTPSSQPIWDSVNIIAYLQFPWRLLGPLGLALAILAGMNALWLTKLPTKALVPVSAGLLSLVIMLAFPLLYVPEWRNTEVDASIAAYHQEELAGRQLGTTFTNEYLPTAVATLADPTPSLLEDYADGYPVDRAHRTFLPEGVTITLVDSGIQYNTWRVEADEAFTMEVLTLYWPGWTAEVDGETVPITPSPVHGFISFPVEAGEHTVRVYLGSTPPRDIGALISIGAALTLAIVAYVLRRRKAEAAPAIAPLAKSQYVSVLAGGVIAIIGAVVLLRPGISWLETPIGESPAQHKVRFYVGEFAEMIGYDINGRTFRPGDTVELTVYWYPTQRYDINYHSFAHIFDWGPPVAQQDKLHPAGMAVKEWWTPDGYIFDRYRITLPPDLPAGEYGLRVGLYTCETRPPGDCGNGDRPVIITEDGERIEDDVIPLGTITVR